MDRANLPLNRACHAFGCESREPFFHKKLRRCSRCKEVWYCSREHQLQDRRQHKKICNYVADHSSSVWLHVKEGQGDGLTNEMTTYLMAAPDELLQVKSLECGRYMSSPLICPYGTLLGWDVQIYCYSHKNNLLPEGRVFGTHDGSINAAAIYLGCGLGTGISRYISLTGDVFVTGRRMRDGHSLNRESLLGILMFIRDAMDLYGQETDDHIGPTLLRWARQYKEQKWEPENDIGGVNVYSVDAYGKVVDAGFREVEQRAYANFQHEEFSEEDDIIE